MDDAMNTMTFGKCAICEVDNEIDSLWVCRDGRENIRYECVDEKQCRRNRKKRTQDIIEVGLSKGEDWSNLDEDDLVIARQLHLLNPKLSVSNMKSGIVPMLGTVYMADDIFLMYDKRYQCWKPPPSYPDVDYHDFMDVLKY